MNVCLNGEDLEEVECFIYMGVVMVKDTIMGDYVNHIVGRGLRSWVHKEACKNGYV